MALSPLFSDTAWDAPFYKLLAPNDTGTARGHQGGMVIPKDLRSYFPGLAGATSASSPTLDHRITALLYVNNDFVGSANTRYQFQTWGGDRSPESRLTDNLGPLRNRASGGDFLIIQRSVNDLNQYRLVLVTRTNADHGELLAMTAGRKWGLLTTEKPLNTDDLVEATSQEVATEHTPFTLIDSAAIATESRSMKMARSIVFTKTVLRIYESKCCVCGESLVVPDGAIEVQAAHIVPRAIKGADDARNGLCLCTRHHWAFDKGLFGIDANRKIFVPSRVLGIRQNEPVAYFHSRSITEARDAALLAAPQALKWHMENVVLK